MPCNKMVTNHLLLLYKQNKEELIKTIQESDVAVTTDLWMAVGSRSYITITVHFIKDWKLMTSVLGTRLLDERHSEKVISQRLAAI